MSDILIIKEKISGWRRIYGRHFKFSRKTALALYGNDSQCKWNVDMVLFGKRKIILYKLSK